MFCVSICMVIALMCSINDNSLSCILTRRAFFLDVGPKYKV